MSDDTLVPTWELHHRLRRALEVAGLAQADMAEYLGVHENTVSAYLTGKRRPKNAVLRAWALRCGVPYEWLAQDDQGKRSPTAPIINGPLERATAATAA